MQAGHDVGRSERQKGPFRFSTRYSLPFRRVCPLRRFSKVAKRPNDFPRESLLFHAERTTWPTSELFEK